MRRRIRTNFESHCSLTLPAILFLITIAVTIVIARRGQPVVAKTNLENLPTLIDGFMATEDAFPQSVYSALNADKHVYRHYSQGGRKRIDLYIGYYGTAKGGRTPHNPYGCLPGAGWGICEAETARLHPQSYPQGVSVNYILARKRERFETILHWYQSAGTKVLSTGFDQNIHRFLGKVLHNRNDGAFVRVSVPTDQSGIEEANRLTKSFAEHVLELLPKYWPEEQ